MSQFDSRGPPSKRGRMDGYKGPTTSGRMYSEREVDEELNKVDPKTLGRQLEATLEAQHEAATTAAVLKRAQCTEQEAKDIAEHGARL